MVTEAYTRLSPQSIFFIKGKADEGEESVAWLAGCYQGWRQGGSTKRILQGAPCANEGGWSADGRCSRVLGEHR